MRGLRVRQAVFLRVLARLSPGVARLLSRGRAGAFARRVLDVVVPAGGDAVATVTGGPLKGTKMRLDPRKQKEMLVGTYETGVQQALQRYAGSGDVVFDVGAHVGFFSLLAARVVGEEGRVVALEPDPYMSERLTTNLDLNGISNVEWQNAAAGETAGEMTFAPGHGAGTGRLSEEGTMTVRVVTIEDLAQQWGAPRIIKVDVEGGELGVLAGAERILREHHPVLIVEAHGPENERAAEAMLKDLDYGIGYIDDVSGRRHLLATAAD